MEENWTVVNDQIKFGQNGTLGETSVARRQNSSPVANTGNQVKGDDFTPQLHIIRDCKRVT